MEKSEIEQRTNMKFCFKLGKTATETNEMLVKVYGDAAVNVFVVVLNRLKTNNAQIVSRLRQQMKTSRKSTK
jgi:hypothetical protein